MNREIKFRVWDKVNNKFYSQEILDCIPLKIFLASEHIHEFTGLRDRNGKEIYEGEICKCSSYDKTIQPWIVVYRKNLLRGGIART